MISAATDARMPVKGPATAKSKIASLFFGVSLKVVTVLVVPVTNDGTRVGTEIFICGEKQRGARSFSTSSVNKLFSISLIRSSPSAQR